MPPRICKAVTKDGRRCNAPVTSAGLCFFHAHPDQTRTLGQKGGRRNRRSTLDIEIREHLSAAGLGNLIDHALAELVGGRLAPRAATALAQLVNARRHLIETIDLERHVAELERKSVKAEEANRANGNGLSADQMAQENDDYPPCDLGSDPQA